MVLAAALRIANESAAPRPEEPRKRWKFLKMFGAADRVRFPDGTWFEFPLKQSNEPGAGYLKDSEIETDDERVAKKLREASKNPAWGIVEVQTI